MYLLRILFNSEQARDLGVMLLLLSLFFLLLLLLLLLK